jgi:antitoxin MazE
MLKKLTKIGNSVGVILDRPLLERLGLDESSEVEVSTDGSVILLSPKRDPRREARLKEVSDWMFDTYAGAFKKLAE